MFASHCPKKSQCRRKRRKCEAFYGGNLQSAVYGALTAGAFYGVGELSGQHGLGDRMGAFSGEHMAQTAGHAVVGCASAAAQGGSCKAGAASAGFAALAGPMLPGETGSAENFIAHLAVGGTASRLSGDSFANGAVTAAFGYLFNQLSEEAKAKMQAAETRGMAALTVSYGDSERFLIGEKVQGHFQIETNEGRRWVRGTPDAVVIDKKVGTVMLCEFKGGMCSSYTPAQREYLGKPVVNSIFTGGDLRVTGHFQGMFVNEAGYRITSPTVFAEEGSRAARSSVSRTIRARGGRISGYAP